MGEMGNVSKNSEKRPIFRGRGATAIVGVEIVNAGIVHSRQRLVTSLSSSCDVNLNTPTKHNGAE